MKYIMVLNDGETFTDVDGCAIVAVPDDADSEQIEAQLDADDGTNYHATFHTNPDGKVAWWTGDDHHGTIPS
jgi:hypothetical protein